MKLKILQPTLISHNFHTSSASSMSSLTQIQMLHWPTLTSMIAPILGGQFVFTVLQLPISMHPVIYVVLVGCTENAFIPIQTGMENILDMIPCSYKLALSLMECLGWQLLTPFSSSHSLSMTHTTPVPSSIGCFLAMNLMRILACGLCSWSLKTTDAIHCPSFISIA
jgi:hypothetical protein